MLLGAVALGAVAVAGFGGGALTPPYGQAYAAAPAAVAGQPSFADIVAKVKPAVVSVRVKVEEAAPMQSSFMGGDMDDFGGLEGTPFEQFFRRFGQPGPGMQGVRPGRPAPRRYGEAQGSGFFITSDGYIVTNNHVVEKGTKVEVITDDGRTLPAKIVGRDPKTDLALLKTESSGPFPTVSFAKETPRIGDWVIAVGNPFGLGGTVTAGIVSARGRDIGAGPYDDFLQIDAPVNRGNSGGPTFNLNGEVVGVNTAIASPSGGSVGIAFAIPADTANRVVSEIREYGAVKRGFLGVQIQPVTQDIAEGLGLEKAQGALVAKVESNTPGARAGLKSGDAITAVNGKPVKDARGLSRAIAMLDPGSTAELTVYRNGKAETVKVKLGAMPGEKTASGPETGAGKLGLALAPADEVRGMEGDGVAVVGVAPGSQAEEKGVRPGDRITEVGGEKVSKPKDVAEAIEKVRKEGRKAVLLKLASPQGERFLALTLPTG
ncbi:Do family serine endopeptidase [Camelimonas abortus]|uniref:Probable periplasmic serine endoprotease DegP-like n=1 Tax=Camelimonas abortus TaxID=1017184 RepID=A0ABV7LF88_9HYPH